MDKKLYMRGLVAQKWYNFTVKPQNPNVIFLITLNFKGDFYGNRHN